MRLMILGLLASACVEPSGAPPLKPGKTDTGVTATTSTLTSTGGVTTTSTPPYDCDDLADAPLSMQTFDIETTEDFDFDADGNMVFAQWLGSTLFGVDYNLNVTIISAGVHDTRGISVLEDGRIIIAYIGSGVVGVIDPTTGSNTNLITGLVGPNALEVGLNDLIYFTETGGGIQRVRQFNIQTQESTPVADGFTYPNGLVINETHDVLYVSDSAEGVYEVRKNADGTWAEKELLFNPSGFGSYDGMEVDACGNLYILGFNSGQVARFDPDVRPLEYTVLAELENSDAFLWNAMHWGSDRGGWRRDTLYVTDRNKVFALELGVPGKAQPVDSMP